MPIRLVPLMLLSILSGCFVGQAEHDERLTSFDVDGDGLIDVAQGGDDCDDADPSVGPGLPEVCNGIDDDCDGTIDEDVTRTGFLDADGDGIGAGEIVSFCPDDPDAGDFVQVGGDCDDTNDMVNPDASEDCDNLDNDCDGIVDNDISTEWYEDADEDGFGNVDVTDMFCLAKTGWSSGAGDCDDLDGSVNPDAPEVCGDGIDNDCDGEVDTDAEDVNLAWLDSDGDGWGDGAPVQFCGDTPPTNHVTQFGDCEPLDASVNPGADDICNGEDDNCDGIDDNGSDGVWYIDVDGDGFGADYLSIASCSSPGDGWVQNADDCDDDRFLIKPTGIETCNGFDDDCSGTVDDNLAVPRYWADTDGDGFGDPGAPSDTLCAAASGFVNNQQDCDDAAADVNPLGQEICANDGIDNDCDGNTGETPSDRTRWYPDGDADGHGDPGGVSTLACSQPSGMVAQADADDCDDVNPAVNPGETEVCNGIDDDCSGNADGDAVDRTDHYMDVDRDGYGAGSAVLACDDSADNISATNDDCDDSRPSVNPLATEVCNGLDDDCDGTVDGAGAEPGIWYRDVDLDGWGDGSDTTTSCTQPAGYVSDAGDCDDDDGAVSPSEEERCATAYDDDCDGLVNDDDPTLVDPSSWYIDNDNDGYGLEGSLSSPACDGATLVTGSEDWVSDNTDCDDAEGAINPGADEECATDGIDDNCSGAADESSAIDATDWYPDNDGDDFGSDVAVATRACDAPVDYVADNTDCDDNSINVNTDQDELCSTAGIDDDCDGDIDEPSAADTNVYYLDTDDDGVGLASEGTTDACSVPSGYSNVDGDCDNNDGARYPGNTEVAYNGIDDDCVGGDLCDVDLDGLDALACSGGTDCDDSDDTILECDDFPYTPPNVDPGDYTPAATVDFTGCSGTMTLDMEDGTYNSTWSSCTTTPTPVEVTMSNGQPAYVLATEGWIQPAGVTVEPADNDRALIVLVYGDATIDGIMHAGAVDGGSGPGGNRAHCTGYQGADGTESTNGGAGGGGGSGTGGQGGANGGGGAGGGGATLPGSTPWAPLVGGCQGGWGGYGSNGSNSNWAAPGYGGGAFQMSVSGTLDLGGDVWAGGGRGRYGDAAEGGGGGGGGGGTILLQADDLIIDGRLGASGGGGGGGASSSSNGGNGQHGSRTNRPSGGTAASGAGTGGDGGDQSAGPENGGTPGTEGGGGGGGGKGTIRLTAANSCTLGSMTANPTPSEACP